MTILITVLYRVRFYVLFQFPLFDGTMQANLLEANCQLFLCSLIPSQLLNNQSFAQIHNSSLFAIIVCSQ